jgi:hypothetical protein
MPRPNRQGSVVLREQRDADGVRHLSAAWREDGSLVIEGQDLGPGVERAFGEGYTEYEWAWTIPPDAVEATIVALGGGDGEGVLTLLQGYAAHGERDPGSHLREAGVPIEFWSRVGD